ncbi:ABC transporter substrate-binding protein [Cohnella zeiphila]|uniref:ABC transporter substrate-binding protein n=1 Tax=Cohnella zeiphila TaxID=2761120 RepID=A0A7X0VY46_9BACL|nr:ABC transporter substrate-binding protein [Cohnella zeiphila]MBB6734305.1 ABC transporter substrate-binding protein [Cohnella zeiphila]
MKRYFTGILLLAAMLAALAGCGSGSNSPAASGSASSASASPSASSPASSPAQASASAASDEAKHTQYPLTITDGTGQSFTFEKAPERIVSTSPAETEILFALGLGDKIVGVSDYDNYPAETKDKTKVGSITKPNEETLVGLTPDFVVTGISMPSEVVQKLRGLKLSLFQTNPKTVDDIMNDILTFGRITDRQTEAEQIVASMKADVQKVKDAVAGVKPEDKKKVYVEFAPGWTVGKGEFMDELIQIAGGVNVAGDTEGWNQISEEKIVQANPDVILFTLGVTDDQSGKSLEEVIRGRSGWDKIKAIQDNRVIGVDQDVLSRPGPRIAEGLLAVAKAIYPDLVKE